MHPVATFPLSRADDLTGARRVGLAAVVCVAVAAGCQDLAVLDPLGVFTPVEVHERIALLAEEEKVHDLTRMDASLGSGRSATYHCAAIDRHVARGAASIGPLVRALEHPNRAVQRNAAIALARLGDTHGLRRLVGIIRSRQTPSPETLTAARALASLDSQQARALVVALVRDDEKLSAPVLEVLIEALGRRADPSLADVFRKALVHRSPAVRRAGAAALAELRLPEVCPELVALATESNRWVRLEAVRALAASGRGPELVAMLLTATSDRQRPVRLAAIRGLGRVGPDREGRVITRLLALAKDESPGIREAALEALDEAGRPEAICRAADDPHWQIRRLVARLAGRRRLRCARSVLARLIADRVSYVQLEVIEQAARLPESEGTPILIQGLAQPSATVAREAWTLVDGRIDASLVFSPQDGVAVRRQQAEAIRAWWTRRSRTRNALAAIDPAVPAAGGATPAPNSLEIRVLSLVDDLASSQPGRAQRAVEALTHEGPDALRILEQKVLHAGTPPPKRLLDDVLPKLGPAYAGLVLLDAEDRWQRQRGAQMIAAAARDETALDDWLAAELATRLATESDEFVWRRLAAAVAKDHIERLGKVLPGGLAHEHYRVRQAAAEYAGRLGDATLAVSVEALLDDPRRLVRKAAARALGHMGSRKSTPALKRALRSGDAGLRLAAAASLVRLGSPDGYPELRQALAGPHVQYRVEALTALADAGAREYLAWVVGALDDRSSVVRRQAVATLERLTGKALKLDADNRPLDLGGQVRQWKQWWRRTAFQQPQPRM